MNRLRGSCAAMRAGSCLCRILARQGVVDARAWNLWITAVDR